MTRKAEETIALSLLESLPQSLLASIHDGLETAGERAWSETSNRDPGHVANALGQARHFHSNESFARALDMSKVPHNPLRGNDIIIGQIGPLLLGRFSTSNPKWSNAQRSTRRLELAAHNTWLERLFQPGFFDPQITDVRMAVFFVSVFSGSVRVSPERPLSVEIAVMDTKLSERLFCQSLPAFISRYAEPATQPDMALVRLKKAAKKQQDGQS